MKIISFFVLATTIVLILSCKKVNDDCNLNEYPNAPTSLWFSSFNGSQEESHGHFILACSDGGYIQIGETGTLNNNSKLLIVKTDGNGDLIWKKEFHEGNNNLGNSIIETTDGYLICGALNENSSIIKLNKNDGTEIFTSVIDNGGNDAFEHLALTNNGIVAVGYINADDATNTFYTGGQGYVTFLDFNGNKTGEININNHLSQAYRIKNYNNELLISGLTENANDYGLIKIDEAGNIIWSKKYGGDQQDHCFGMDVDISGNIYLTGHSLSNTENWDTYTLKIDNNGNLLWENTVGNPRGFKAKHIHDEAWGVKNTNDGGCIIVAGTGDEYKRYRRRCGNDGDNSNTWHVYLIKFNENGFVEWEQTYGGGKNQDWAGEDIDINQDGELIIAVDNGQFGFLKLQNY